MEKSRPCSGDAGQGRSTSQACTSWVLCTVQPTHKCECSQPALIHPLSHSVLLEPSQASSRHLNKDHRYLPSLELPPKYNETLSCLPRALTLGMEGLSLGSPQRRHLLNLTSLFCSPRRLAETRQATFEHHRLALGRRHETPETWSSQCHPSRIRHGTPSSSRGLCCEDRG